ncbi:hypothetical protein QBC44DRAFT_333604 [Cladorrhinum sp. PSN332]|nr:hypothetical protein QBC44DRAFT_333604 [Cladorrhinum sp. PSN332]
MSWQEAGRCRNHAVCLITIPLGTFVLAFSGPLGLEIQASPTQPLSNGWSSQIPIVVDTRVAPRSSLRNDVGWLDELADLYLGSE